MPNPDGRPTLYKAEYCELVYKLCLLGAIDEKIADILGVAESTLNLWKLEHPEFSESIKRGKEVADAEVAEALFNRAKGYEHDDVEIKVVAIGDNQGSKIVTVPVRKIYPPDTGAAMAWLKNRQPKTWRDKQEIEITGNLDIAERARRGRERANAEK